MWRKQCGGKLWEIRGKVGGYFCSAIVVFVFKLLFFCVVVVFLFVEGRVCTSSFFSPFYLIAYFCLSSKGLLFCVLVSGFSFARSPSMFQTI